ncbi:MAG: hypothetical protein WBQ46_01255 [Terriglobales bacterium]
MNWDDYMQEKMEAGIADLAQQRGVDIFVRISDDGTWQITVKHGRYYRRAPRTIFFIEESPQITDFPTRLAHIQKAFEPRNIERFSDGE